MVKRDALTNASLPEATGHVPAPTTAHPEVRDGATEYDVRCVIDVEAQSPVEAARAARRILREPGQPAGVFIVTQLADHGAQWRVDLDYPGSEPEVLRTREEAALIAGTGLDTATGPGSPDGIACIRALRDALAEARQALAGDSNDAEHDALVQLMRAAAAFARDEV